MKNANFKNVKNAKIVTTKYALGEGMGNNC